MTVIVILTICLLNLFMSLAPQGLNLEGPERRNLKNLGLDHREKKVLGLQTFLLILPGAEEGVEEFLSSKLTPSLEEEDSDETS